MPNLERDRMLHGAIPGLVQALDRALNPAGGPSREFGIALVLYPIDEPERAISAGNGSPQHLTQALQAVARRINGDENR